MVNFKGTGGKSIKFRFDCDGCILFTRRSINIKQIHFPIPYTICLFKLFLAAELSLILQRLILLYRSLRFSDRNLLWIVILATDLASIR